MRRSRLIATRAHRVRVGNGLGSMVPMPKRPKVRCEKCEGTGKVGKGKGRLATHKADCGCIGCRPCKECVKGLVEAPPRVRQERAVEVREREEPEDED